MLATLVAAGALGQKSGAGFYKKVGKDILRLDFASGEYVAGGAKADELVARILKEKDPVKRMQALRASSNPQAQFLWAIFRDVFHYIALHLDSVADNARDIDFAMRWGFGWEVGPFETWQASGWQQVAAWVKDDIDAGHALCNAALPAWVFDGRANMRACIAPTVRIRSLSNSFVPRSTLPVYARQAFRAPLVGEAAADGKTAGVTVHEDDSVRIWHQNDDVLIISLKTKMHVIGEGVVNGLQRALAEAEQNYKGLVIWNTDAAAGGAFSAGADLQEALPLIHEGRREGDGAGHRLAAGHLHGAEIRERTGSGGSRRPGARRRLRNGAACGQAGGVDRVLHRPGRSRRRPDSGRRRLERSGSARGSQRPGQRPAAIPESCRSPMRPPPTSPNRRWKRARWVICRPMT